MKLNTTTAILAFLLISLNSYGQRYKEMMLNPQYNYYEVVEEAEKYFSTHSKDKGSGYIGFERWKYKNEPHFYPSGERSHFDPYSISDMYAVNRVSKYSYKNGFVNGWVDLGPYDADNITSHYSAGIGRVECFYVDKNDPRIIYLGSRSGGFWRTSDEGVTWENTTDTLVASGVNTLAVSPTNNDSILINVRNADNGASHGIYRSTDGGSTWQITAFSRANLGSGGNNGPKLVINKIVYHPLRPNVVFIGTTAGIYRSTDGLASYTLIKSGNITDIEFHPTNADIIYYFNNQTNLTRQVVSRSLDGGLTFYGSFAINGNNSISYIAVSPTNPDLVYLGSSDGVWKSEDAGLNFTYISLPNKDESCRGFAVSDIDTNIMFWGYVDAFVSTDEGNNFSKKTSWSSPFSASYIHADIRTTEIINGVIYVGTDGYLCKSSDNGNTFTKLNNGTGIRENYRLGVSQSNVHRTMVGSQDNGTSIYTEDGWIEWNGGDGMEAIIHPLNEDWMIGSWQYGQRSRTLNGGKTRLFTDNPQYGSGMADWVAPMLMNHHNHMSILHFSSNIYRSDSFGEAWTFKGAPGIGRIQCADISFSDSNKIIVSRQAEIRLTTDGGNSFTIINGAVNSSISSLSFDPRNDNRIIATYASYGNNGQKIYISENSGSSWTNITFNLSNMPIYDAVIDHSDSSFIYVATEIGVYYKSLLSTHWELYSDNLPNVSVGELEIQYGSNRLRAATWGRGLWDYTLIGRENYPAIVRTSISNPPTKYQPAEGSQEFVEAKISYNGQLQDVFLLYAVNSTTLNNRIDLELLNDSTYRSVSPLPTTTEGDRVFFKVFALGSNSDLSETYRYMYEVRPFKYCEAYGNTNTTADHITSVKISNIENPSGQDYYGDFTDQLIYLHGDSTYTMTVGLDYHWPADTVFAWIDYDFNSTFDNDELINFGSLNSSHKAVANFSIPRNINTTDTLRMRVRSQYAYPTPQACGPVTGEVEDYSVLITPGTSKVLAVETTEINLFPNPSSTSFELEFEVAAKINSYSIYSMDGKILLNGIINGNSARIDHHLSSGMYMITLSGNDKIYIKKFIVKN